MSVNYQFLKEFKEIIDKHGEKLIKLYNISEIENTKDHALNPNVGVNRELDLVSFLHYFMKIKSVKYYFRNNYDYDVAINGEYYSIKHQTGDSNSGIKIKWGTNMIDKYMNNIITFDYHMIIISINRENQAYKNNKTIKFYIIFADELNKVYMNLKTHKIKTFTTDSRGISFSSEFMKNIKEASHKFILKSRLLKNIDDTEHALDFRLSILQNMVLGKPIPHDKTKFTWIVN